MTSQPDVSALPGVRMIGYDHATVVQAADRWTREHAHRHRVVREGDAWRVWCLVEK